MQEETVKRHSRVKRIRIGAIKTYFPADAAVPSQSMSRPDRACCHCNYDSRLPVAHRCPR